MVSRENENHQNNNQNNQEFPHLKDLNIIGVERGDHRYVLAFDHLSIPEAYDTLKNQAEDPNLNFTEEDAETMSDMISFWLSPDK